MNKLEKSEKNEALLKVLYGGVLSAVCEGTWNWCVFKK